jgi:16S rRNA processing protein RimM
VCVPRDELPERDDKDYYRADLIGCEVVNLAGIRLGLVQHFVETPAQVLMVVRGGRELTGKQEFWVPAIPQHLRRVDLEARRIIVDWAAGEPGAGLPGAGLPD